MGRIFAIVVAAALVGGIAGAAIGIAVDGGRSSSSNPTAAPVVAQPTSVVHTVAALSPEAIYRADSPAVVEIKDTVTQVVPPTFFTPGGTEQVGALGSGFVIDRKGDIVTNDHVVAGRDTTSASDSAAAQRTRRRSSAPTRPPTSRSSASKRRPRRSIRSTSRLGRASWSATPSTRSGTRSGSTAR